MKQQTIGRNNRGSAIIIVLVAVAFLTILGSLLLFTTYTGYQMKIVERKSAENFYSAETAVNEVRIGVQKAASDAIAAAYTSVLESYNTSLSEDSEDAFRRGFVEALYAWKSDGTSLFTRRELGTTTYNPAVLRSFLTVSGATLTAANPAAVSETDDAIILRGLRVDYTDAAGYQTSISTDISIGKPSFTYALSDLILSAVQDYTVIAKNALLAENIEPGKTLKVDGNAYAGSIHVTGAGTLEAHDQANFFICRDLLDVESGRFIAPGKSLKLWAGGIVLGNNASVKLECSTYVQNDLVLSGNGAEAVLSGQYYGFGTSDTSGAASSSILINGRETSLDLSGLNRLVLAGNSFVNANGSDVMMGESVSVRKNQLAYLIPFACFDAAKAQSARVKSNPELFGTDEIAAVKDQLNDLVDLDSILWSDVLGADGQPMKLGDYVDGVQTVYQPITSTQTLVYFYMHFRDKALANSYFKAYFDHNSEKLQSYLELYSKEIKLGSTTGKSSAGGLLGYEGGDSDIYYEYTSVKDSILRQMRSNSGKFQNLCATLSTEVGGATENADVYDYLVDEDKFRRECGERVQLTFFDPAATDATDPANVWAVMVNGSASYGGDTGDLKISPNQYPNLRIIIATGDVEIKKDFEGLVVSGKDVRVSANLKRRQEEVSEALRAVLEGTAGEAEPVTLLDFLKNIGTQSSGSTSVLPARDSWNLEKLVTYDNWTKNPN